MFHVIYNYYYARGHTFQEAKYGDSAEATDIRVWATGQIGQLLGDGRRSYVVGYGSNPPERPHHRSR